MHRLVLWFVKALMRGAQALPERQAMALGRRLGVLFMHLLPSRRDLVARQLRLAFRGEKSLAERREIARNNFAHYGQCTVEFLRIPLLNVGNVERAVHFSGLENLAAGRAPGRGVIALCGHYGNWDLMAVGQALRGLGMQIITKEASSRGLNEFWMEVRRSKGVQFLPGSNSAFALLRVLRRGGTLGMAFDQHRPGDMGVWGNFFGRPASTMRAAALLALKTGCAVVPTNSWRGASGLQEVVFGEPLPLVRGASDEETIYRSTQAYNDVLEGYVRQHPEQWLWIHRRWKRRRTALTPYEVEVTEAAAARG